MVAQPPILVILGVVSALALASSSVTADVTCTDPCTINASFRLPDAPGYSPAVAVLENGTSVVWHSSDGATHPHSEVSLSSDCIDVTSSAGSDSDSLQFQIWNGTLRTTTGATSTTCGTAVGTSATGFTLAYHCRLHASMNGRIVVLPDA
jgi:plastocyanin